MADPVKPDGGDNSSDKDGMVPAKDLLAVKDTLKAKDAEIASKHAELLKVQAQLDTNAKELADLKLKVDAGTALQSQYDALKKSAEAQEAKLAELTATSLQIDFGIDAERLKGKKLDELTTIREVLLLAGQKPGQRHDGGSGTQGGHQPTMEDLLRQRFPSMYANK